MDDYISYQILNQGRKPLADEMWFLEKAFPLIEHENILACQDSGLLEKGDFFSFTDLVWYGMLGELKRFNHHHELLLNLKNWLYKSTSFMEDTLSADIFDNLFPFIDDNFDLETAERLKASEVCKDKTALLNNINGLGFTHLSMVVGICLLQRKDINLTISSTGGFALIDVDKKAVCFTNNNFGDEEILCVSNLSVQRFITLFIKKEDRGEYRKLPKVPSEVNAVMDLILQFLPISNEIVISKNNQTNKINVNVSKNRNIVDTSALGKVVSNLSLRDHREIRVDTQATKSVVSYKDKYIIHKEEKAKVHE
jgi:hypothetical protein